MFVAAPLLFKLLVTADVTADWHLRLAVMAMEVLNSLARCVSTLLNGFGRGSLASNLRPAWRRRQSGVGLAAGQMDWHSRRGLGGGNLPAAILDRVMGSEARTRLRAMNEEGAIMPPNDLAIVLTGTIVPSAPFTVHNDPRIRRREYLEAIRFYSEFAPVYFLENSPYPLGDDAEFNQFPNVRLRQRPLSTKPERGKGYQEFEMIDGWLLNEPQPPRRWVKITGRYLYRNLPCCWKIAAASKERR